MYLLQHLDLTVNDDVKKKDIVLSVMCKSIIKRAWEKCNEHKCKNELCIKYKIALNLRRAKEQYWRVGKRLGL